MKQKGKAGLFFLSCYLLLFCCSSPLTSLFLFHVFCIVLSPIYPNIKTDASSQTNDRPMYSTWFFFGLYDLVFFKMHKLLLTYKIVWHQLFACLFVSSPPNISHSRLEGWMMALHTRLATPPNSDEGQEKTERVVGSPRCSSSTCLHHPHHQNNHNHQHPHHHRLLTSLATLFKRQKKWPLATKRKKRGAWNLFNAF